MGGDAVGADAECPFIEQLWVRMSLPGSCRVVLCVILLQLCDVAATLTGGDFSLQEDGGTRVEPSLCADLMQL